VPRQSPARACAPLWDDDREGPPTADLAGAIRFAPHPRTRDTQRAMPEESTTSDLVELSQQTIEDVTSGDLDVSLAFFSPGAVFAVVALGASFEGVAAIRGFMDDWFGSHEEIDIEVEEILDLGNGVTFGVFVQKGRPAGSTGRVRYRLAQVTTWVDGAILRVTGCRDISEARAAAERLAEERG
jgi:hypothetical protein